MQRNPNPNPAHVTPRQLEVLTLVRDYRRQHGYSPTLEELAERLGVSKVTVFEHLGVLAKKGLLRHSRYRARSLEVSKTYAFPDQGRMPLMGHIAAGRPIEAVEDREDLDLNELFASRGETFVLRVRGDSMIEDQIRDGDYVVVERRTQVSDGETVVALLENGEATLKRIYQVKSGGYRLQAANPAYEPIFVPAEKLAIQGVVVGVLRRY